MSRKGTIAVAAASLFLCVAGVIFFASSRRTCFPEPGAIRIDPDRIGHVIVPFTPALGGLYAVEVRLTDALREARFSARLLRPGGGEATRLLEDRAHSSALRRRFRLSPPLEGGEGVPLELHLRFAELASQGGNTPALEEEGVHGISVTAFFPLHLRAALENYTRFKPVPAALLFGAALLALYAVLLCALLRGVEAPSRGE